MKGLLIYNGHLKLDKITKLIDDLVNIAVEEGVELYPVKNNEIAFGIEDGQPSVKGLPSGMNFDFVLFWDKDIRLCEVLENLGYRVFNSSTSIFACDNKMVMHNIMSKAGIKVPRTIFAPFTYYEVDMTATFLQTVKEDIGYPLVLKEAYGSFGMQVHLITSEEQLKEVAASLSYKPFLLQKYIEASKGRDVRLNFVGQTMVGAMERRSEEDFRANITLGGKGYEYQPSEEEVALALSAHNALGLAFSGVDLIFDENNEPILCEINSNPNYLSTMTYTNVHVGRHILRYIKECIHAIPSL